MLKPMICRASSNGSTSSAYLLQVQVLNCSKDTREDFEETEDIFVEYCEINVENENVENEADDAEEAKVVLGASNEKPARAANKKPKKIKTSSPEGQWYGFPTSDFTVSRDWLSGAQNASKGAKYNFRHLDITVDKPWIAECRYYYLG
ncbi:uncharacterized protein LY79DRAFT_581635 [Colletotrichum navitas]|uniref:Uncharacterized protein n=1 Tax=Colletotrichum navitas TaxID=681940 RepID=A0AAD8PUC9_9PEZI|nr:uncharacterized protein LY79DRAFT_581635 [Colletotrichum navitas]KAK1580736.1 hypothetical protein LY79DRAFT_581635 [Colletotrichum navitas]